MKNIKSIKSATKGLFVGACLFAFAGCNNFLDVAPLSQLSPETYFWTDEQLGSYTIKYYDDILPSHHDWTSFYHDDNSTDNESGRSSSNVFVPTASAPKVGNDAGGEWSFSMINNMNFFLEIVVPRYERGEITGSETMVKHYIGEGYFLRAMEYYYRLRKLGDFPIITRTLPDNKDTLMEASRREPRNEVARFILSDMDKAIELLSNDPVGGRNRITKDVAYLMKARIALYEGTFERYHKNTARVPLGPGWPGLALNPDYKFPGADEGGDGTLEGEIKFFLNEALEASKVVADAHPNLTTNTKQDKGLASKPANDYYDMFIATDPSGYDEALMYRSYDRVLGVNHSFNKYMYGSSSNGYTLEFEKAFLMENGLPWYANGSGYAGDTLVEKTKENRDWRWRLFMKAPNEYLFKDVDEKLPAAPQINNASKYGTGTGFIQSKGYTENVAYIIQSADVTAAIMYRSAEAYLIYIEAAYELFGQNLNADAWTYWGKLRERAGITGDVKTTTIANTDMDIEKEYDWAAYSAGQVIDETLYNIRRERRCEFISEGQRWDDLVRWRALDQINGNFLHGCRIFDKNNQVLSVFTDNGVNLSYTQGEPSGVRNTASSPTFGPHLSLFKIVVNEYNNGLFFKQAHYLSPINYKNFQYASPDGMSADQSTIYQNPGWPLAPDAYAEY